MLHSELIPLCEKLKDQHHITIETAGTLYLPVACDLMSISPKLSNSTPDAGQFSRWSWRHERTRRAPEVIRRLVEEYPYQMKFVVDKPSDCDEVEDYLSGFPEISRDRVMLMPQATEATELAAKAAWVRPYCRKHGLRYCGRHQINWFGLVPGT